MPIVTDGLVGYWNSKQGVNGAVWENIAPNTKGQYNGTISGAVLQIDGMYFDGVNDYVSTPTFPTTSEFTLEVHMKYISGGSAPVPVAYYLSDDIRGNLQLNRTTDAVRWSNNDGGFYATTATGSIPKNTLVCISVRVKGKNIEIFLNGTLANSASSVYSQSFGGGINMGRRLYSSSSFDWFKGHISSTRLYNRFLSNEEISQNYAVGTEVGLSATPPPTTPIVTQLNASKTKISDEPTVNQSVITVQFDSAVTQYVARLNGVDYATGTLVHTGGAVSANTDAQVIVDWTELTTEGSNRINVYGQNANGWTVLT